MKKYSLVNIGIISILGLLFVGCASNFNPGSYSEGQVMQQQSVTYGTIVSVAYVKIKGSSSPIGTIAGGVAGGVIGHNFGGGNGQTLATVAGVIGGAVAGNAIQKAVTTKPGVQLAVKEDNGNSIVVVQGINPNETFTTGERVAVITSANGTTRVAMANNAPPAPTAASSSTATSSSAMASSQASSPVSNQQETTTTDQQENTIYKTIKVLYFNNAQYILCEWSGRVLISVNPEDDWRPKPTQQEVIRERTSPIQPLMVKAAQKAAQTGEAVVYLWKESSSITDVVGAIGVGTTENNSKLKVAVTWWENGKTEQTMDFTLPISQQNNQSSNIATMTVQYIENKNVSISNGKVYSNEKNTSVPVISTSTVQATINPIEPLMAEVAQESATSNDIVVYSGDQTSITAQPVGTQGGNTIIDVVYWKNGKIVRNEQLTIPNSQ